MPQVLYKPVVNILARTYHTKIKSGSGLGNTTRMLTLKGVW
jgi:hypothetical protein